MGREKKISETLVICDGLRKVKAMDSKAGFFTNGMEFAAIGTGGKVILVFNGGPGNIAPGKQELHMFRKLFHYVLKL